MLEVFKELLQCQNLGRNALEHDKKSPRLVLVQHKHLSPKRLADNAEVDNDLLELDLGGFEPETSVDIDAERRSIGALHLVRYAGLQMIDLDSGPGACALLEVGE